MDNNTDDTMEPTKADIIEKVYSKLPFESRYGKLVIKRNQGASPEELIVTYASSHGNTHYKLNLFEHGIITVLDKVGKEGPGAIATLAHEISSTRGIS